MRLNDVVAGLVVGVVLAFVFWQFFTPMVAMLLTVGFAVAVAVASSSAHRKAEAQHSPDASGE